jgi:hypothetical protein
MFPLVRAEERKSTAPVLSLATVWTLYEMRPNLKVAFCASFRVRRSLRVLAGVESTFFLSDQHSGFHPKGHPGKPAVVGFLFYFPYFLDTPFGHGKFSAALRLGSCYWAVGGTGG